MDNPNSFRGLLIGAVLIAAMAVVMVVVLLFSPDREEPVAVEEQETVRLRPSDETVDRVVVPVPERETEEEYEDWQEVIQLEEPRPTSDTVIIREDENDTESPFSIDDLSHLDLGPYNNTQPVSAYVPPTPEPIPEPDPDRFSPPEPGWDTSSYVREEYDSLGKIRFKECGEIIIPSGFGLIFFESRLELYDGVICMGEAVGNSCDDARLYAMQEGEVIGQILVTEFPDGSCGVGAAVEDELLSICSLEELANRESETTQSESSWMRDFDDEPGYQFAELYRKNNDVMGNPDAVEQFGCELYEFTE